MFVTLQGLEMEIYPETLIPGVDETISVVAIAVHVADVGRKAAVRHENRHLTKRFGRQRPEIPHRRRRVHIRFWMPLPCMDEVRKLVGVSDKEGVACLPTRSQLPSFV